MSFLTIVQRPSDADQSVDALRVSSPQVARNYAEFRKLCDETRRKSHPQAEVVFFVDADNLKQINSTLGHAKGDAMIAAISDILFNTLPPGSIILRKGGDEFLSYCQFSGSDNIEALATTLAQKLNCPSTVGDHPLELNCSLGAAVDVSCSTHLDELIEAADVALVWAKRHGKRQLKFYDLIDCASVQFERSLSSDFEQALVNGDLYVSYQPVVDIFQRQVCGAEALIRWDHPKHGDVDAELIISTAAKTGRLYDLGGFVLREACKAALAWPEHLFLSINFAASDFQNADFATSALETIAAIGIDPARVRFEITELEFLVLNDAVMQNLDALQATGVQIGVDDFGTGYSAMGSIDRFPADFIKIDRSLVQGCNSGQVNKIFLGAIQKVALQMDINLVAEGVETVEELAIVGALGINLAQGFYYSPALDAAEFVEFVETKEALRKIARSKVASKSKTAARTER